MNRRSFIATLPALAAARAILAADRTAGAAARLGLCTFSCHQHWKAVLGERPGAKFTDARGFYDYTRGLGGDGVQAPLRGKDSAFAKALRAHVEKTGGYYEGDIALPKSESGLDAFEAEVRLVREAGGTVARSVLLGSRRYETFKTREEFLEFRALGARRLAMVEPVLRRHGLTLALENHKDQTTAELVEMLRQLGSEWLGVNVDTGNNIALLEEPHAVVEALAPFARSVHLKDMAVQPSAEGFLLSETPFGAGFLDLPRMVATLRKANPRIVFNVEMATRDPLHVPCRTDAYWATFGRRDEAALTAALERVRRNPPKQPPPRVTGLSSEATLALEQRNNQLCLAARSKLNLAASTMGSPANSASKAGR